MITPLISIAGKPDPKPHMYPVSEVQIGYKFNHTGLPPTEFLLKISAVPGDDGGTSLKSFNQENETRLLSVRDINDLSSQIINQLNDQGIIGVYVAPDPKDISTAGIDLRPSGDTILNLVIYTTAVNQVSARSAGDRFKSGVSIDRAEHTWVIDGSPLTGKSSENQASSALNKRSIDRYLFRLNRHPGRRVSADIQPADQGLADIVYAIFETKPWIAYGQLSNTGSENTDPYEKRVGFIHNQITGNDDILSIDLFTAGLEESNSANISYDMPWGLNPLSPWRAGIQASYSDFTNSDVGEVVGADFTGRTRQLSTDVTYQLYQEDQWFLDAFAGLSLKEILIDNDLAGLTGEDNFLKPDIGFNMDHQSRVANTSVNVSGQTNLSGLAGTDVSEIEKFGRSDVDNNWIKLNVAAQHSFFLEPIIFGEDWRNPNTPETSTLAHEMRLSFDGQWVPDKATRLIPQEQFVVGGLNSVRGYPESVANGDSGYVGSLEYRLHLPRLLPVKQVQDTTLMGRSFRTHPTEVYNFPDWDFVLKGFLDVGQVFNNSLSPAIEEDETLIGIGIGTEIWIHRNARFRLDAATALSELDNGLADEGNQEIHLEFSLFF